MKQLKDEFSQMLADQQKQKAQFQVWYLGFGYHWLFGEDIEKIISYIREYT
jgi:hypothetical protein